MNCIEERSKKRRNGGNEKRWERINERDIEGEKILEHGTQDEK